MLSLAPYIVLLQHNQSLQLIFWHNQWFWPSKILSYHYIPLLSLGVLHTAVSFVFPTPLSAFACFILISEFVSVAIFWNFCRFSFSGFKIDVSKYWHVARFIKGIHSHAKPGQWTLSKVEELSKGSSCEISFFIIQSVAPSYHFVEHLEQLLIKDFYLFERMIWEEFETLVMECVR